MDNLLTVQRVFIERLFRVPDYQRGYAWEELQWNDLLEDLELLAVGKNHYAGTLILYAVSGRPKPTDEEGTHYQEYDVIDGQQRLTTIVLILDAVRREMQQIAGQQLVANGMLKHYIAVNNQSGQRIPKLQLNRDDHEFFFNSVLGQRVVVAGPAIASHERLLAAKNHFDKYLHDQREKLNDGYPGWLEAYRTKITQHLQLLVYEVGSEAEAGVIFETMNNRGKPITELEKVKNYLLYLSTKLDLPDEHNLSASINGTWTRIFQHLMQARLTSQEAEDRLLRAHWLMAYDYQTRNWHDSRSIKNRFSLRVYLNRHVELLKDVQEYVDTLSNAAIAYADIYHPSHPAAFGSFQGSPPLRGQIIAASERLLRLGAVASFLPLLIAIRLKYPAEAEAYLHTVDLCEHYAFRVLTWRGLRSNAGLSRLYRMGYDLFQGRRHLKDVPDDLRQATLDYCNDGQFMSRFEQEENWYNWSGIKYFLYEYEEHLAKEARLPIRMLWQEVDSRQKQDTIEHILPQTPEEGGYWMQKFSADERGRYTHDIGNLCLTHENSALSNKPFLVKRGQVGQGYGYANSVVLMEKELARCDDWTPDTLRERRQKLAAWAKQRWHIDAPSTPPSLTGSEHEAVLIRRLLTREPRLSKEHAAIIRAIYEAGENGLSGNELAVAVSHPARTVASLLGSLGRRINGTEGANKTPGPGIGLLFTMWQAGNLWRYRLTPVMREVFDDEDVAAYLGLSD